MLNKVNLLYFFHFRQPQTDKIKSALVDTSSSPSAVSLNCALSERHANLLTQGVMLAWCCDAVANTCITYSNAFKTVVFSREHNIPSDRQTECCNHLSARTANVTKTQTGSHGENTGKLNLTATAKTKVLAYLTCYSSQQLNISCFYFYFLRPK